MLLRPNFSYQLSYSEFLKNIFLKTIPKSIFNSLTKAFCSFFIYNCPKFLANFFANIWVAKAHQKHTPLTPAYFENHKILPPFAMLSDFTEAAKAVKTSGLRKVKCCIRLKNEEFHNFKRIFERQTHKC